MRLYLESCLSGWRFSCNWQRKGERGLNYLLIPLLLVALISGCINGPNIKDTSTKEPQIAQKVTISNYQEIFDKNDITLIEFYSGACGTCQEVAWVIDSLAVNYNNSLFIGANNTDDDSLYEVFHIDRVPAYVIFMDNEKVLEFNTIDTAIIYDTLSSLLESAIAGKLVQDTSDTTEPDDTTTYDYPLLNDFTFDTSVLCYGRTAMVFFLVEMGYECIPMIPIIEDIAKHYKGKAVIARYHVVWGQSDIYGRYDVNHCPEYRFFKDSTEIESERRRGLLTFEELESIIDSLLNDSE